MLTCRLCGPCFEARDLSTILQLLTHTSLSLWVAYVNYQLANEHIKIGSNSYEKGKTFKYLGSLLTNQDSIQGNKM